jgi:Putative Actinobacterial Holin-X, holin superfamily III
MSVPGVDQVGERPLEELVQTVSRQAAVLAREQVNAARRELIAKATQSGAGVAMVGGGALLAALASGTGTASLVLLLARRSRASAAALGVTGAYAGAAALLGREGLQRLREAGPSEQDVPVRDRPPQRAKKQKPGSAKRRTVNAKQKPGSAQRRAKSAAKRSPKMNARAASKSSSSRGRGPRTQADRARRRAS